MSARVVSGITVSRADDRLIAVKRAEGDDAERCRTEARLLARLDHPGLVQYVALIDGDPVELHTAYAGTDTWERVPPQTSRQIIEGLATITSTIADLHDLGTAHRSLVPAHVIVGSDHRPVLCGLGDALAFDPVTEADDLAGLAGLIRTVARAADAELQSDLHALADHAIAGDLTARTLTDGIDALHCRAPATPRRRRRAAIAIGVAATVVVALLTLSLGSQPSSDTGRVVAPTTTLPAAVDRPITTTSAITPPSTTPAAPDDGLELIHNGRRYGVGGAADIAVIGDWNCDGVSTPAILQLASSSVSVFFIWPDPGTAAAPDSTTALPGATGLEVVERDQCDQLRVLHSNGSILYPPEIP